jgi:coiled-coil domain-containing protein 130
MGRYHRPDSLDKSLSTGTSSSARRQQAKGPPTIRFEMPFAVWCTTCDPEAIIGQGVRFNAQKTKVGTYHTTPIWSFTMKHGACSGIIEIRTDPAIGDYVVEKGGRKRDYGPEVGLAELGVERERKDGGDPFAGVEGRTEMEIKTKTASQIIERLRDDQDRKWEDPWSRNRRLRREFRVEREAAKEKDKEREGIKERFAFGEGVEILDGTEEDGRRARHVEFGEDKADKRRDVEISKARGLFDSRKSTGSKSDLQRRIQNNTRSSIDPFLSAGQSSAAKIVGLKRKRPENEQMVKEQEFISSNTTKLQEKPLNLVDYESD